MAAIQKKEDECKIAFHVKHTRVGDVEATVLVLIATRLMKCVFKNKETEEKECVVLELATLDCNFLIHNDEALNRIPSFYFLEKREKE